MRKAFYLLLIGMIAALACSTLSAFAAGRAKVVVDGWELSLPADPILENGTLTVPFRALFEAPGLHVEWDGERKRMTGVSESLKVELRIGSGTAEVNGGAVTLPEAPFTRDGYAYVPLRFVGEAAGREVTWNGDTKVVTVGSAKPAAEAASISGTVYDPSGLPLTGALVQAGGADNGKVYQAITDKDGYYSLSGVKEGERLYIGASPAINGRGMVKSETKSVTYDPGQATNVVDLYVREADVEGRALDENGNPLIGAEVLLSTGTGMNAAPPASVYTGPNG